MNKLIKFIFILAISLQVSANEGRSFGTGADMSRLVQISTLLNMPEKYLNKDITITGTSQNPIINSTGSGGTDIQ